MAVPPSSPTRVRVTRAEWGAFMIGVGVMAAVDEIVFHQLLAWHHFLDTSTSGVALFSDGVLHGAELVVLVAGFFVWADARRRPRYAAPRAWAALPVGAGVFQMFDGLVDHKVLRVHQVRYGVELWPYDLAWNVAGLLLVLVGIVLGARARRVRSGGDER